MDVNNIKASIEFVDSYVRKFNIEINKPPASRPDVEGEMKIDYTLSKIGKADGCLYGGVDLQVNADLLEKEGVFSSLNMVYTGVFKTNEETPEDVFKKMLELNGVMVLYQLSRSLITSITAQAGLVPALTLPLINVHKVIDKKKSPKK